MSESQWSSSVNFSSKVSYIPNTEEQILTPSGGSNTQATFGENISLDNDGTRVIVGAKQTNTTYTAAGKAYIFKRTGTTWAQEATLQAADHAANNNFGASVDMDSTGTRVVIGSPRNTHSGTYECGALYIYLRSGTTWTQEAKLTISNRETSEAFGTRVAIDETGTRIIGTATAATVGGVAYVGRASIFTRSGTTWTQEQTINPSDYPGNGSMHFGTGVDINANGTRVVVGARNKTVSGVSGAGMLYVYVRSGVTWNQETTLITSSPISNGFLGYACAIDSAGARIVGAVPGSSPGSVASAGSLYVFSRSGSTWSQEAIIITNDKAAGDSLGYALGIDATGSRIVAGAYAADPSSVANAGKAYTFTRSGSTWSQEMMTAASDKTSSAFFGWGASISGDGSRLCIGAFGATSNGYAGGGKAYMFA